MQPHSSNNTRTTPSNVTDCHLARKPNEANNVAKVTAVSSLAGKKGGKNMEAPIAPKAMAVKSRCCLPFCACVLRFICCWHANPCPFGPHPTVLGCLGEKAKNWMDGPPR